MDIATFTHIVYQNEVKDSDTYCVAKHQPYFEFSYEDIRIIIGLDDILECLLLAHNIHLIPKISNQFWSTIIDIYDIPYSNHVPADAHDYSISDYQPYFEFEQNGVTVLIGMDSVLECIILADKIQAIPKLSDTFWSTIIEHYDVNYFEYELSQL